MKTSFIVAVDQNNAIGYRNQLPWHMPADLKYFRDKTLNKPIIMGRKTYESIGRPLPERRNIIITRDNNYTVPGCEVFTTIDAAFQAVADCEEVMVIGGANLFQQVLPRADRIYLTIIQHQFTADTYLDDINFSDWRELERTTHAADAENPYDYCFLTLER